MDCSSKKEFISDYVAGELEAGERDRLVAHLDDCHECRAAWRGFEAGRSALASRPPRTMPRGLRERLSAMTRAETEPAAASWLEPLRAPRAGWAFAAATALAAALLHFEPFAPRTRTVPLARLLAEHASASRKSADIGRGLLAAAPYDALGQADAFK